MESTQVTQTEKGFKRYMTPKIIGIALVILALVGVSIYFLVSKSTKSGESNMSGNQEMTTTTFLPMTTPTDIYIGVTQSPTTRLPTTTMAPTTTFAPTTTMAPTTTRAPTTTIAPTTTFAPTTTIAPVMYSAFAEGYEEQPVTLSCNTGTKIKSAKIKYGRWDNTKFTQNHPTVTSNTPAIFKEYDLVNAIGKQSYTPNNSKNTELGEDPYPGVYKQWEINYTCSSD